MSGSGGGGGYEYQAKATAYVAAHILAQQRLGWIEHQTADLPIAVAAETDGPGDDLRIKLHDNIQIELQAKHGLQKDKLWEPLLRLGSGLQENPQLYGVLLTDSTASKIIREDLRNDFKRLGQGRTDRLKAITQEVQERFVAENLPTTDPEFFRRLVIVVLDLDDGLQDGKQAQLLLAQVLHDANQSASAWNSLCKEGQTLISKRGHRDSKAWARLLSSQGIQLASACARVNGVRGLEETEYLETLRKKFFLWWKDAARFMQEINESTWHEFRLAVETPVLKDENHPSSEHSGNDRKIALPLLETVLDVLDKSSNAQVLIVGKPGAGKTTFLTQLVWETAERALKDSEALIPVLLDSDLINSLSDDQQSSVTHWIRAAFEDNNFLLGVADSEKSTYIEKLIRGERLLILVDGVNEFLGEKPYRTLKRLCGRNIPIILTTRDIGADSLRIEQKLEIQSLKAEEVKQFFKDRLPNHQNRVKELCERVRDFGQTPLMVWMLYSIFQQNPQDETPKTRGEAYRRFTTIYAESAKEGIDLSESRSQLSKLAFEMICSERPAFEQDVQHWLGTERSLKYLLSHHLLQWEGSPGNRKVEFCHQSLQEYYAAEYLYSQLDHLSQKQREQRYTPFQTDYLNYLKWTESIAFMLGFPELSDDRALRVVELGLDIDLMLGARLAGEVKTDLQTKTIRMIAEQEVVEWFRIFLLRETKSSEIVDELVKIIVENPDPTIRRHAVLASRKLSVDVAMPLINLAIENPDPYVRETAIRVIGELDNERAVSIVAQILPKEPITSVREVAVICILENSESEAAILELLKLRNDPEPDISIMATYRLEEMNRKVVISVAAKVLRNRGADTLLRSRAAELIGDLGDESNIADLSEAQLDSNEDIRSEATDALYKLRKRITTRKHNIIEDQEQQRKYQIDMWHGYLTSEEPIQRSNAIYHLAYLLDKEEAIKLVKPAVKDLHYHVRGHTILRLVELHGEEAIPQAIEALADSHHDVREQASQALVNLKQDLPEGLEISTDIISNLVQSLSEDTDIRIYRKTVKTLINLCSIQESLLSHENLEAAFLKASDSPDFLLRSDVARALGQFSSERVANRLLEMINDSDPLVALNAAKALENMPYQITVQHLPALMKFILDSENSFVLDVILSIQSRCGFYNYEIIQSFQNTLSISETGAETLLDVINQTTQATYERVTQMADQPKVQMNFNAPVEYAVGNIEGDMVVNSVPSAQEATTAISNLLSKIRQKYPNATDAEILEILTNGFDAMPKKNPQNWQRWKDLFSLLFAGGTELIKIAKPEVGIPIEVLKRLHEIYNRNRKRLPDN